MTLEPLLGSAGFPRSSYVIIRLIYVIDKRCYPAYIDKRCHLAYGAPCAALPIACGGGQWSYLQVKTHTLSRGA